MSGAETSPPWVVDVVALAAIAKCNYCARWKRLPSEDSPSPPVGALDSGARPHRGQLASTSDHHQTGAEIGAAKTRIELPPPGGADIAGTAIPVPSPHEPVGVGY